MDLSRRTNSSNHTASPSRTSRTQGSFFSLSLSQTRLSTDQGETRVAKRKMNKSGFYGEVLSVKYAPEFETVLETRAKLENRRVAIQFLGSLSLQRLPKIKGAPEALQSQSSSHLDAAVWFREPFLDDRLSHLSTSARHFPEDQRASSSSSSSSSSSASPSPSSVLVKRPRSFETNTAARSVDQTLQNVRNKLRKLHDQ